jgi:hypothetical protein
MVFFSYRVFLHLFEISLLLFFYDEMRYSVNINGEVHIEILNVAIKAKIMVSFDVSYSKRHQLLIVGRLIESLSVHQDFNQCLLNISWR